MNLDVIQPAKITAVISTHNRCSDLRDTLSRLQKQSEDSMQIIVVDNASTDQTREMVRSEFPDVLLVPHSANRAMEGYNAGFTRARSEYILVLDDDSCPEPGSLHKMLHFLESHPEAGAAAANIIDLDGSSEWAPRDHISFSTQWDNLIGCGLLIRRSVLLAAGCYKTDFDLYYNDLDLALSILALGYRIVFCRDWVVEHRRSPDNRVHSRKVYMMLRNFSWIVRSHFNGFRKVDLLLGHAFIMLRQAARSKCLGSGMRYLWQGLTAPIPHPHMPIPPSPARRRFCAEYALSANILRILRFKKEIPEVPEETPTNACTDTAPPLNPVFPAPPKKSTPPQVCYWKHRIGGCDIHAMRDETAIRERRNEDRRTNCDCAEMIPWYRSPWPEYQRWLMRCSYLSCSERRKMRNDASQWIYQPLISIIIPTYKSNIQYFEELLLSIERQLYTNWQLCIVDDGSQQPSLNQCIEQFAKKHPNKVKYRFNDENKGIGAAEQDVLELADGEFVALTDHDDRLLPEALYEVVKRLNENPEVDWFYSDMDKLSPEGERFMHFFKPDWSPDYLRCCNYVLHLSVIRRSLMFKAGGFSTDCDGAQDFDLYLRLAENTTRVCHIPRVLYSFRMSETSTAADLNAKPEIYEAGRRKLAEAYQRRGFHGHPENNTAAWSGHYRLVTDTPPPPIHTVVFSEQNPLDAAELNTIVNSNDHQLLLVKRDDVQVNETVLQDMAAQVLLPGMGAISPKILSEDTVDHCGLAIGIGGKLLYILRDLPADEAGYGAVGAVTRNVSVSSPVCTLYNLSALRRIGGFSCDLAHGLFIDTSLTLQENNYRVTVDGGLTATISKRWFPASDIMPKGHEFYKLIKRRPTTMTAGDPYYNRNLNPQPADFGGRS